MTQLLKSDSPISKAMRMLDQISGFRPNSQRKFKISTCKIKTNRNSKAILSLKPLINNQHNLLNIKLSLKENREKSEDSKIINLISISPSKFINEQRNKNNHHQNCQNFYDQKIMKSTKSFSIRKRAYSVDEKPMSSTYAERKLQ